MNVNDGKGLFDNLGLIDTLIVDCNELTKDLVSGKYVQYCAKIVEMIQKLSNLRNGVKADSEAQQEEIAALQKLLDDINGRSDS